MIQLLSRRCSFRLGLTHFAANGIRDVDEAILSRLHNIITRIMKLWVIFSLLPMLTGLLGKGMQRFMSTCCMVGILPTGRILSDVIAQLRDTDGRSTSSKCRFLQAL